MNSFIYVRYSDLYFTIFLLQRHKQTKKELFVMAIQTSTGKTFPGNFTIIRSAKKWVFHAIYHLAFLSLYGDLICSLNWLVLTDKEDAEYRSFENLIVTHDMIRLSTVMLCTFHAIWQPFKRDTYNLLPSKKTKNGKLVELTEVGRSWGKWTFYTILDLEFHKSHLHLFCFHW